MAAPELAAAFADPGVMAAPELAAAFADPGVATAYRHRPPYPDQVFDLLAELVTDEPRRVLDLGAGDGAIARPLATRVDQVDALDVSAAMLAEGARRPGGQAANLRWILGAAESAELGGPYALVTAGASLHWMEWGTTLARISLAMTPSAVLAIIEHGPWNVPWKAELSEVISRHSRSPGYDPHFSLPAALSGRGLLTISGETLTAPVRFRQSVDDYVEQFYSTAALARFWMRPGESAAFDAEVRRAVAPHAVDGVLDMAIVASVTWGRPQAGG
jgi:SAM-dependent methyltransferase